MVLLVAAVLLGLLLGGATFALNRAFPPERLAALLAQRVRDATGRDFRIAGDLSIQLLPRIGVVARDVMLGNAAWSRHKEMARVGRVELRIELWPLLSGKVAFERAAADGVDLWLETSADGVGNWVFEGVGGKPAGAPPATPGGAKGALAVDLREIELSNARLNYLDARSGTARQATLESFELRRQDDASRIEARFGAGGETWTLKGRTGSPAALAAGSADWPFDLTLSASDASIRLEGRRHPAGAPTVASARIEAKLTSAKALAPWFDAAARVPMPLELRARLRYTVERADFDDIDLALAGQRVGGQASVRVGSPWDVRAELAAKTIDLDRWMPSASRSAPPQTPVAGTPRRLFGAAPLPFDLLAGVPADIGVQVGELRRTGSPTLKALRLRFRSAGGQARVEGLSLAMAGGTVTGRASVKPQPGAPATLTVALSAKNLQAASLSQQSGAGDYLRGGQVDVSADLASKGRSPSELAASATGELLVSARDVTLREGAAPIGPNLLPMLLKAVRLDGAKSAPTHIECLVVRLPFKDGLAVVDRSIALETEQLAIVAKGNVDLRSETLQLALRSSARQVLGLNTAQLASLVVVKGPLREPHVGLDAQGAAGVALSLGAAAASGGLSMLGQNLMHQAADPHPCRFAATGVRSAAPEASDEPAPAKGGAPTQQKLPALLRQLFGQGKAKP